MPALSKEHYASKLTTLDLFVVTCVVTILGIRLFLELTGYPQIGGNGLHIAHMLWGGLGMCGVILYLLLSDKPHIFIASAVSGVSFGFFIDELGKFITSDNNYFYKPTAFLVYVILLTIWLGARYAVVRRHKGVYFSEAEWPEKRLYRLAILSYAGMVGALGAISVLGSITLGKNWLGFYGGLESYSDTVTAIVSLLLLSGVYIYKKRPLRSASLIRIGILVSAVGIYPFTFYRQQFTAAIGLCLAVLVVIGLSEASLKGLLRSFWGGKS